MSLVVGQRVENGGHPFALVSSNPKKSVIQFTNSGHRMTVDTGRVLNSIAGRQRIVDPYQPKETGFRRGTPIIPHLRDRKDRFLTKMSDEAWKRICTDVNAGRRTCEEWFYTYANFEKWFFEEYGDDWQQMTGYEKLFCTKHYSQTTSAMIPPYEWDEFRKIRGLRSSAQGYKVYWNGKVIGVYLDSNKAIGKLIDHVKEEKSKVSKRLQPLLNQMVLQLEGMLDD